MVDQSVVGRKSDPAVFEVEKGRIGFFADAVGDENPVYKSEELAREAGFESVPIPPTFMTACTIGGGGLLKTLDVDFSKLLHGEQTYEFFAPICAGMKIEYQTEIVKAFSKEGRSGSMDFYVFETRGRQAGGEPVFSARSTIIIRHKK